MTIRDLLLLHPTMRCLCGKSGMERNINYIDIVEIPEGASWSAPGDFIITTGYFFRTDADFEHLVRGLILHQVSGLGIKLGKYVQELPAAVRALSEEYVFPIVAIPLELSYREIQQFQNDAVSVPRHGPSAVGSEDVLPFFREALYGSAVSRYSLEQMAADADLSGDAPWLAAVAETGGRTADELAAQAGQGPNGFLLLCDKTGAYVAALFSPRRGTAGQSDIDRFLQHFHACCGERPIGVGEQVTGPVNIAGSYRHALFALKVGTAVAPEKTGHRYVDYLDYAVVSENENGAAMQLLLDRYLTPVLSYDKRKRAQLAETLAAIDRCGYNMALSGRALHVHRNTLYARVHTISRLLAVDLGDAAAQHAIHLALAAHLLSRLEL